MANSERRRMKSKSSRSVRDLGQLSRFSGPPAIFITFLFLFLTCLSIPFIQSIRLFTLHDIRTGGKAEFGLWGYCIPDLANNLHCSKSHIGWTFKNIPTVYGLDDAISPHLTGALFLHALVAIILFLLFLLCTILALKSAVRHKLIDRFGPKSAFFFKPIFFVFLAAFLTTLVFVLDIAVVNVVKDNVLAATNGDNTVYASIGSLFWLVFIAVLIIWVAVLIQGAEIMKQRRSEQEVYDEEHLFDSGADSVGKVSSSIGSARRRSQHDTGRNNDGDNTSAESSSTRARDIRNRKRSSYYNSSEGEDTDRSIGGSSRPNRSGRNSAASSKSKADTGNGVFAFMCKRNKKREDGSDDEEHEMRSLSGRRSENVSHTSRSAQRRSAGEESMRDAGKHDTASGRTGAMSSERPRSNGSEETSQDRKGKGFLGVFPFCRRKDSDNESDDEDDQRGRSSDANGSSLNNRRANASESDRDLETELEDDPKERDLSTYPQNYHDDSDRQSRLDVGEERDVRSEPYSRQKSRSAPNNDVENAAYESDIANQRMREDSDYGERDEEELRRSDVRDEPLEERPNSDDNLERSLQASAGRYDEHSRSVYSDNGAGSQFRGDEMLADERAEGRSRSSEKELQDVYEGDDEGSIHGDRAPSEISEISDTRDFSGRSERLDEENPDAYAESNVREEASRSIGDAGRASDYEQPVDERYGESNRTNAELGSRGNDLEPEVLAGEGYNDERVDDEPRDVSAAYSEGRAESAPREEYGDEREQRSEGMRSEGMGNSYVPEDVERSGESFLSDREDDYGGERDLGAEDNYSNGLRDEANEDYREGDEGRVSDGAQPGGYGSERSVGNDYAGAAADDFAEAPAEDYNEAPAEDYNEAPVEDYNEGPAEDYNDPPAEDYNEGENYVEPTNEDYVEPTAEDYVEPAAEDYVEPTDDYVEPTGEDYVEPTAEDYDNAPGEDYAEDRAEDYDNAPAEDYNEAPAEDYNEAPAEGYNEAPTEDYNEAPAEDYNGAPAEDYNEAPVDDYAEAPTENYNDTPAEDYAEGENVGEPEYREASEAYANDEAAEQGFADEGEQYASEPAMANEDYVAEDQPFSGGAEEGNYGDEERGISDPGVEDNIAGEDYAGGEPQEEYTGEQPTEDYAEGDQPTEDGVMDEPVNEYVDDPPADDYVEDAPADDFVEDAPADNFVEDAPADDFAENEQEANYDEPAEDFTGDEPAGDYVDEERGIEPTDDVPGEEYAGDEVPGDDFANDAPAEEAPAEDYIEDAPAEDNAEDAPAEEYAEDAPAEEYVEDAPAEEYAEDAPAEEFAEDAPAEEVVDDQPYEETAVDEPVDDPMEADEGPATDFADNEAGDEFAGEDADRGIDEDAPADEYTGDEPLEDAGDPPAEEYTGDDPAGEVADDPPVEETVEEAPADDFVDEEAVDDFAGEEPTDEFNGEEQADDMLPEEPAEGEVAEEPTDEIVGDVPADDVVDEPAEEFTGDEPAEEFAEDGPVEEVAAEGSVPAEELAGEELAGELAEEEPTEESAADEPADDFAAEEPGEDLVGEEPVGEELVDNIDEEPAGDFVDDVPGDEIQGDEPAEEIADDGVAADEPAEAFVDDEPIDGPVEEAPAEEPTEDFVDDAPADDVVEDEPVEDIAGEELVDDFTGDEPVESMAGEGSDGIARSISEGNVDASEPVDEEQEAISEPIADEQQITSEVAPEEAADVENDQDRGISEAAMEEEQAISEVIPEDEQVGEDLPEDEIAEEVADAPVEEDEPVSEAPEDAADEGLVSEAHPEDEDLKEEQILSEAMSGGKAEEQSPESEHGDDMTAAEQPMSKGLSEEQVDEVNTVSSDMETAGDEDFQRDMVESDRDEAALESDVDSSVWSDSNPAESLLDDEVEDNANGETMITEDNITGEVNEDTHEKSVIAEGDVVEPENNVPAYEDARNDNEGRESIPAGVEQLSIPIDKSADSDEANDIGISSYADNATPGINELDNESRDSLYEEVLHERALSASSKATENAYISSLSLSDAEAIQAIEDASESNRVNEEASRLTQDNASIAGSEEWSEVRTTRPDNISTRDIVVDEADPSNASESQFSFDDGATFTTDVEDRNVDDIGAEPSRVAVPSTAPPFSEYVSRSIPDSLRDSGSNEHSEIINPERAEAVRDDAFDLDSGSQPTEASRSVDTESLRSDVLEGDVSSNQSSAQHEGASIGYGSESELPLTEPGSQGSQNNDSFSNGVFSTEAVPPEESHEHELESAHSDMVEDHLSQRHEADGSTEIGQPPSADAPRSLLEDENSGVLSQDNVRAGTSASEPANSAARLDEEAENNTHLEDTQGHDAQSFVTEQDAITGDEMSSTPVYEMDQDQRSEEIAGESDFPDLGEEGHEDDKVSEEVRTTSAIDADRSIAGDQGIDYEHSQGNVNSISHIDNVESAFGTDESHLDDNEASLPHSNPSPEVPPDETPASNMGDYDGQYSGDDISNYASENMNSVDDGQLFDDVEEENMDDNEEDLGPGNNSLNAGEVSHSQPFSNEGYDSLAEAHNSVDDGHSVMSEGHDSLVPEHVPSAIGDPETQIGDGDHETFDHSISEVPRGEESSSVGDNSLKDEDEDHEPFNVSGSSIQGENDSVYSEYTAGDILDENRSINRSKDHTESEIDPIATTSGNSDHVDSTGAGSLSQDESLVRSNAEVYLSEQQDTETHDSDLFLRSNPDETEDHSLTDLEGSYAPTQVDDIEKSLNHTNEVDGADEHSPSPLLATVDEDNQAENPVESQFEHTDSASMVSRQITEDPGQSTPSVPSERAQDDNHSQMSLPFDDVNSLKSVGKSSDINEDVAEKMSLTPSAPGDTEHNDDLASPFNNSTPIEDEAFGEHQEVESIANASEPSNGTISDHEGLTSLVDASLPAENDAQSQFEEELEGSPATSSPRGNESTGIHEELDDPVDASIPLENEAVSAHEELASQINLMPLEDIREVSDHEELKSSFNASPSSEGEAFSDHEGPADSTPLENEAVNEHEERASTFNASTVPENEAFDDHGELGDSIALTPLEDNKEVHDREELESSFDASPPLENGAFSEREELTSPVNASVPMENDDTHTSSHLEGLSTNPFNTSMPLESNEAISTHEYSPVGEQRLGESPLSRGTGDDEGQESPSGLSVEHEPSSSSHQFNGADGSYEHENAHDNYDPLIQGQTSEPLHEVHSYISENRSIDHTHGESNDIGPEENNGGDFPYSEENRSSKEPFGSMYSTPIEETRSVGSGLSSNVQDHSGYEPYESSTHGISEGVHGVQTPHSVREESYIIPDQRDLGSEHIPDHASSVYSGDNDGLTSYTPDGSYARAATDHSRQIADGRSPYIDEGAQNIEVSTSPQYTSELGGGRVYDDNYAEHTPPYSSDSFHGDAYSHNPSPVMDSYRRSESARGQVPTRRDYGNVDDDLQSERFDTFDGDSISYVPSQEHSEDYERPFESDNFPDHARNYESNRYPAYEQNQERGTYSQGRQNSQNVDQYPGYDDDRYTESSEEFREDPYAQDPSYLEGGYGDEFSRDNEQVPYNRTVETPYDERERYPGYSNARNPVSYDRSLSRDLDSFNPSTDDDRYNFQEHEPSHVQPSAGNAQRFGSYDDSVIDDAGRYSRPQRYGENMVENPDDTMRGPDGQGTRTYSFESREISDDNVSEPSLMNASSEPYYGEENSPQYGFDSGVNDARQQPNENNPIGENIYPSHDRITSGRNDGNIYTGDENAGTRTGRNGTYPEYDSEAERSVGYQGQNGSPPMENAYSRDHTAEIDRNSVYQEPDDTNLSRETNYPGYVGADSYRGDTLNGPSEISQESDYPNYGGAIPSEVERSSYGRESGQVRSEDSREPSQRGSRHTDETYLQSDTESPPHSVPFMGTSRASSSLLNSDRGRTVSDAYSPLSENEGTVGPDTPLSISPVRSPIIDSSLSRSGLPDSSNGGFQESRSLTEPFSGRSSYGEHHDRDHNQERDDLSSDTDLDDDDSGITEALLSELRRDQEEEANDAPVGADPERAMTEFSSISTYQDHDLNEDEDSGAGSHVQTSTEGQNETSTEGVSPPSANASDQTSLDMNREAGSPSEIEGRSSAALSENDGRSSATPSSLSTMSSSKLNSRLSHQDTEEDAPETPLTPSSGETASQQRSVDANTPSPVVSNTEVTGDHSLRSEEHTASDGSESSNTPDSPVRPGISDNNGSRGVHEWPSQENCTDSQSSRSSEGGSVSTEESGSEGDRPRDSYAGQHRANEEVVRPTGNPSGGDPDDSSDPSSLSDSSDSDLSSPRPTPFDKVAGIDVPKDSDSSSSLSSEDGPRASTADKGKSREVDDESIVPHMCHSCGRYVYIDGVEDVPRHTCSTPIFEDSVSHFEERIIAQFGPIHKDTYIPFVCMRCGAYIFVD